jgi:cell division protein FtsB
MTELDDKAQRLAVALDRLEQMALPLVQARAQAAKDAAEIALLREERESLLARIAELEDESRALASVTEEVEGRLDGAIVEIRAALGR